MVYSNLIAGWFCLAIVLFALGVFGLRVGWEIIKVGLVVCFAVGVVMLVGCSTMTPEEREDAQWERQLVKEQHARNVNYCRARGLVYYADKRRGRWTCITTTQVDEMLRIRGL